VEDDQTRVRYLSSRHWFVIVVCQTCIKKCSYCQSQTAKLLWICVLVQRRKHWSH
jgi:hypothetical protein